MRASISLKEAIFAGLASSPPDGLLALIAACSADPRPDKIDVGIGVYRNWRATRTFRTATVTKPRPFALFNLCFMDDLSFPGARH